jgi:mannose-6-phosphate isomerase-like protein (cupin superfamily)
VRRNGAGEVILDSRELPVRPSPGNALWGPPLAGHSVTNVGDSLLHVIAIELKQAD